MSDTKVELVGDREIVISRTFRAPARLVFDAWTKAELVQRWWVPKSRAQVVDITADVRVGGTYRYVFSAHGTEYAFSGKYLEIDAPHRLVYTQIFESYPDAALTITVTFEERDGRTQLVSREVYPTKETREAALASGMDAGMREAMDQLDELVTADA